MYKLECKVLPVAILCVNCTRGKMGKKNFGAKKTSTLPILLAIFSCLVTFTLAYFFTSDWASSHLQMSGKVEILAVGRGDTYNSIENGVSSSNLVIEYDNNYGVLIPGEPIGVYVNCKVSQSSTQPLLRAKMVLELNTADTDEPYDDTQIKVIENLNKQLNDIIVGNNTWYLHDDGYYYFVKSIDADNPQNSVLNEIDATAGDKIVNFITEPIKFPTNVTSEYSGLAVKFRITFQAIQNYIPDDNGNKLPNTIQNSQKIFNNF